MLVTIAITIIDNIVQMTFQTYGTKLTPIYANFTNTTDNLTMTGIIKQIY